MTFSSMALSPLLVGILLTAPPGFAAARGQPLAEGLWGGEHIRMEVTPAETKVEFDCAQATISSRVLIDSRGRFVAKGVYFEERGGPVRQEQEGHGYPTQFRGTVKAKSMRLTVTRTDTNELIGAFSLTHGREPELVKCR